MTSPQPRPERVTAAHGGIQYQGEFFRAPTWHDSFGESLEADAYFRVVFLEATTGVPESRIHDQRIAVYVPAPRTASAEQAERQLRLLRETLSDYSTDAATRDALESESAGIEERVVDEWAESFKSGHLAASPALAIDLEKVFEGGFWSAWAERIGAALLARAYPEPAVDATRLVGPLRPELDAPVLLEAAMSAASPVGTVAMEAFGPALGISTLDDPSTFSPADSPLLDQVLAEVEAGQELRDVGRSLAHGHGLTYPLATLGTLLFLTRGTHRLRLNDGHTLHHRDGSPLQTGPVAASDLSRMAWPADLWDQPGVIERMSDGGPMPGGGGASTGIMQALGIDAGHLDDWLATMREQTDGVFHALNRLMSAQGVTGAPSELTLLRAALEAEDPITMFDSAETAAAALRTWQRWWDGRAHADVLAEAISWLGKATVDELGGPIATHLPGLVAELRGRDALARQNRRLIGRLTHRVLSLESRGKVDRFTQVVGLSDLTALAGVLDDELTSFLGSMLREATDG